MSLVAAMVFSLAAVPELCASPLPEDFVPRVRAVQTHAMTVELADQVAIASDRSSDDGYAIDILRRLPERIPPSRPNTSSSHSVSRIVLCAGPAAEVLGGAVAAQSYTLDIRPDQIVITGQTAAARLYGAQTLTQLCRMSPRIPIGRIADGPVLAVRGFSLDISRGRMPSHADLLSILDLCAAFKLNHFFLYIEDTFPYTRLPQDALRSYGLTRESLHDLAQAAALRSITFVPIVQTLGHSERLLSHQSMWAYAESTAPREPWQRPFLTFSAAIRRLLVQLGIHAFPSSTCTQFAVTDKGTQALLQSMIGDVLATSGAKNIHIGCDEPMEIGTGASKTVASRQGVESVFSQHVRRLADYSRASWQARTWLYDDFVFDHPSVLGSLPPDAILVDWRKYNPDADYSSLTALASEQKARVVTSPGLWNWFAIFPAYRRAVGNIARATRAAKTNRCLGSVLASWGDGGSEDLVGSDIVGLAYFADCSWSAGERNRQAFAGPYCRIRFGTSGGMATYAYASLLDLEIPDVIYSQRLVYRPILLRRRGARWLAALDSVGRVVTFAQRRLASATPADTYAAAELQAVRAALDRLDAAIRREAVLDSLSEALLSRRSTSDTSASSGAAAALLQLKLGERRAQLAYVSAWRDHNDESDLFSVRRRFAAQLHDLDSLRACAGRGELRVPDKFR